MFALHFSQLLESKQQYAVHDANKLDFIIAKIHVIYCEFLNFKMSCAPHLI